MDTIIKYSHNSEPYTGFIKSQAGIISRYEPKHVECEYVDLEQVGICTAETESLKALDKGYTSEQNKSRIMTRIKGAMMDYRRNRIGRNMAKVSTACPVSLDDDNDDHGKLLDLLTYDEEKVTNERKLLDNLTPAMLRELCLKDDFDVIQKMQAGYSVLEIAQMYEMDTKNVLIPYHRLLRDIYKDPEICGKLRRATGSTDEGANVLSAREQQVVQYVANGISSKRIAFALNLSVRTVDNHRTNIFKKLNINNIALLTRWAIRNHIIDA